MPFFGGRGGLQLEIARGGLQLPVLSPTDIALP